VKTTATINRSLIAAAFLIAATPFVSQAALFVSQVKLQANYLDGSECRSLIVDQYIEAGEVCVEVQGTTLAVTYNTFGDWELLEAHLWAGSDLLDMPANNQGNPETGNFPYVTGDISGATTYTFNVSLDKAFGRTELCDVIDLLAGHAAVRRDNGDGSYEIRTGWIAGEQIIEKDGWSMFSSVEFSCPAEIATVTAVQR